MKRLIVAFCAVALLGAATAQAEPNGKASGYWKKGRVSRTTPPPAVPEPTAALVFGVGLLATGLAARGRKAR